MYNNNNSNIIVCVPTVGRTADIVDYDKNIKIPHRFRYPHGDWYCDFLFTIVI